MCLQYAIFCLHWVSSKYGTTRQILYLQNLLRICTPIIRHVCRCNFICFNFSQHIYCTSSACCLRCATLALLTLYNHNFTYPQNAELHGFKSGDLGAHSTGPLQLINHPKHGKQTFTNFLWLHTFWIPCTMIRERNNPGSLLPSRCPPPSSFIL